MPIAERWMVLGAGSWLGYLLLAQEGAADMGETHLLGTVHHQRPEGLPGKVVLHQIEHRGEVGRLAEEYQPTVLVNFLRGEEAEDLAMHEELSAICRRQHAWYVLASSVLALDGYQGAELTEDRPPRSSSPYGIFKGRCETHLARAGGDWLVLRFASVQGWVPHKPTRNEKFLRRLAAGEKVVVDLGIRQNRLAADLLVEALRQLVKDRVRGVVHLGTTDASDELDFLREEAAAFGWDPAQVVPGAPRHVNLDCRPERIFQLYGDRFRRREADTQTFLARHPGLQRWHKPPST